MQRHEHLPLIPVREYRAFHPPEGDLRGIDAAVISNGHAIDTNRTMMRIIRIEQLPGHLFTVSQDRFLYATPPPPIMIRM